MPRTEVVIFDDKEDDLWRVGFSDIATESGWEPRVFDKPHYALSAVEPETGAVISVLGANSGNFLARLEGGFEGIRILDKAEQLQIPRALFSGHPSAEAIILPTVVDLLMSSSLPYEEVRNLTGGWLTGLLEQ